MSSILIPEEGLALDSPEIFSLLLNPEEIQATEKRDKINTAYHEAGHAVVALELRCKLVMVHIEPNLNRPSFGEYAWFGKCQWRGEAELLRIVAPAVGVAGEIAVLMLKGEWNDEMPWRLGPEDFNEIDAKSLTDDNIVMALRDAAKVLTRRWSRVEAFAHKLLEHEYLTNGMAAEIIGKETEDHPATFAAALRALADKIERGNSQ